MNNLYLIQDLFFNGFNVTSLNLVSLCSILCGVLVIVNKNPIISILFLIGLFITISIYLMLLGINFIGISYLLVYVGAVSILFIFILMLINIRISEISNSSNNSIPLAIIVGSLFIPIVYKSMPLINNVYLEPKLKNIDIINIYNTKSVNNNDYFNVIGNKSYIYGEYKAINNEWNILFNDINIELNSTFNIDWSKLITDSSHINIIGNILYSTYFIWLLLTSLVLLLSMVGCIVMCIKN